MGRSSPIGDDVWRRGAPVDLTLPPAGRIDRWRPRCSNGLQTGHDESWCSRKKKRGCSTTTTSAPNTSFSASSMRVRAWPRRLSSHSGSRLRLFAARSRRSSVRVDPRRPDTFRSRRAPRRCSSCRCVKRCNSATTTSAPNTSFSASSARAKVSLLRCSSSWAPICLASASRSSSCSPAIPALPAQAVAQAKSQQAPRQVSRRRPARNLGRWCSTSSAAI